MCLLCRVFWGGVGGTDEGSMSQNRRQRTPQYLDFHSGGRSIDYTPDASVEYVSYEIDSFLCSNTTTHANTHASAGSHTKERIYECTINEYIPGPAGDSNTHASEHPSLHMSGDRAPAWTMHMPESRKCPEHAKPAQIYARTINQELE